MAWEPSIGAFFVPVGLVVFVDCLYFLSILLQLRRHPERRYELKEAAEEQPPLSGDGGGAHPASSPQPLLPLQLRPLEVSPCAHAVPLSALENEHTFAAQLAGASGALGLYAALWVFGAMAVSQERPLDLVFACLFGVSALALAAFMLGHHCINRQDVKCFWARACCPGRRAYSAQEDVLLPPPGGASASAAAGDKADGESTRCGHSSADSSCVNRGGASLRNSAHGSKLTNLQAEAAQCRATAAPGAANGAALPDTSLTEHSLDNEIKMHVAPVEVQLRPLSQATNPAAAAAAAAASRHHKNRARAHRASRLTVLREYAYDVPTSLDGSVHSAPHRRHHHHYYDMAARNSRRAAYMAYRERHQSQLQQDSSDGASLPRRPRHKGGGCAGSPGNGSLLTVATTERGGASANSSGKDSEREGQTKAYGLNLAAQNGAAPKDSAQLLPLASTESAAVVKTGLWKHETTV